MDLEALDGVTPIAAIDRYGYTGGLCHKLVKLVIESDQLGSDPNIYANEILPRLRALYGRDPIFGDQYFNGTRILTYVFTTGTGVWIG